MRSQRDIAQRLYLSWLISQSDNRTDLEQLRCAAKNQSYSLAALPRPYLSSLLSNNESPSGHTKDLKNASQRSTCLRLKVGGSEKGQWRKEIKRGGKGRGKKRGEILKWFGVGEGKGEVRSANLEKSIISKIFYEKGKEIKNNNKRGINKVGQGVK